MSITMHEDVQNALICVTQHVAYLDTGAHSACEGVHKTAHGRASAQWL